MSLLILKKGSSIAIRSSFSAKEDVVIPLLPGAANGQLTFGRTFLLPRETPMEMEAMTAAAWPFHPGFDDATPWKLNNTYIGANHGASDLLRVTSPAHGLGEADLGSAWHDGAGGCFYLINLAGPDEAHFLSENTGVFPLWKFARSLCGPVLTRVTGMGTLPIREWTLGQLIPACRLREARFLADGRALEEGVVTPCHRFEAQEAYEIIAPDAVLKAVQNAPGKRIDFVGEALDAILENRIVYRFQPGGACEIRHRATALRDFDLELMGFIQAYPLHAGEGSRLVSCIPKTRPFAAGGTAYDFRRWQDLSTAPAKPLVFSAASGNVADPANLPERFIQRLHEGERQVGFAMGYSLLKGMTQPALRAAHTDSPLFIHTTRKTYPLAMNRLHGPVKAGDTFECLAYRQYFDPASHPEAACVYGHFQNEDYLLYAEFHDPATTTLHFPREVWGAPFEVVEKSASVALSPGRTAGPEGVVVTLREGPGSLVLRARSF